MCPTTPSATAGGGPPGGQAGSHVSPPHSCVFERRNACSLTDAQHRGGARAALVGTRPARPGPRISRLVPGGQGAPRGAAVPCQALACRYDGVSGRRECLAGALPCPGAVVAGDGAGPAAAAARWPPPEKRGWRVVCRSPASRGLRSVSRLRPSLPCLSAAVRPRVLGVCAYAVSTGLTSREPVLRAHALLHTSLTQEASGRLGRDHVASGFQVS